MTQEEKAKAYDEALKTAKEIIEYYKEHHRFDEASIEDLEHIFPELAESEDERIRKGLIKAVSGTLKGNTLFGTDVTREEALTWLEKQGEIDGSIKWHSVLKEPEEMRELLCEWDSDDSTWHEVAFYHSGNKTFWNGERQVENVTKWCYIDELLEKQGESYTKRDVDDAYLEGMVYAKHELEKQGGIDNCPLECSTNTVMTDSTKNQVKPKFKVGDWINGYYTNYKVLSVNNKGYVVEDVCGNKINILFENEKFHHLWTIQDARDGDVLAAHECYVIFKEIDGLNIKCYCTYHYMNNPSFHVDTLQNKDAFHPATKEQRDILMKAMADAGYEWDAEKKELKIKLKEPDVYEYELERIADKLNEVIGKLGDIHQVLSNPYVFPYRDYTSPSTGPGMDVWYKTHGVEKVPPVTCETTNGFNKSENNESNN